MNIETLKAALALLECAESKTPTQTPTTTGRKVIVRSRDAGVLYGELIGNEGSTVYLKNARQLWKWFAAKGISLVDVATYGVDKSKCKFSEAQATVTVFNACALIYTTEVASISIEGA